MHYPDAVPLEILDDDKAFLRGPRIVAARAASLLRLVDMFSGCGGLTLGAEEAAKAARMSLDVRLAIEIDPHIREVYAKNFGVAAQALASDVSDRFDRPVWSEPSVRERATIALVGPSLDVLVGGPPCQGHSTLNNHTRGDDPKNRLYLSMVRATELLNPRILLIENVPAVERDSGGVVERAKSMLEKLKYGVETAVVSVADLGVPQLRKRHVLVAVRGQQPHFVEDLRKGAFAGHRPLKWAIRDLRRARGSRFDEAAVMTKVNLKRAEYLLRRDIYDLPNRFRPPCQQGEHRYKSMYGRLSWDLPAQTITTGFGSPGQGRYLHPEAPRTLTPHEAARIQFFPDWFDFSSLRNRCHVAQAIGNAVPPKLAYVLVRNALARMATRAVGLRRVA